MVTQGGNRVAVDVMKRENQPMIDAQLLESCFHSKSLADVFGSSILSSADEKFEALFVADLASQSVEQPVAGNGDKPASGDVLRFGWAAEGGKEGLLSDVLTERVVATSSVDEPVDLVAVGVVQRGDALGAGNPASLVHLAPFSS